MGYSQVGRRKKKGILTGREEQQEGGTNSRRGLLTGREEQQEGLLTVREGQQKVAAHRWEEKQKGLHR
jgi:hypothetical protein